MVTETKKIVCGFCASHCRYKVKVEDGRLVGFDRDSVKKDSMMASMWAKVVGGCPRAIAAAEYVYHPGRLNYPLKRAGERGEGKWERVSWDQALDEIASKMDKIRSEYGPEALAITSSGEQNTGEEFRTRFQYLFGSPNFLGPHSCGIGMVLSHLMSGWMIFMPALRPETKCLMLIGANPHQAGPMLWNVIRDATKAWLKLIVIDPRRTAVAEEASLWLQPRPGTDGALLMAMIQTVIAEDLIDKEFVEKWCYGFDKVAERVKDFTPDVAESITGVPADSIREAARMYATEKPSQIFHTNGIEEQANCTPVLQSRYILAAITGNIDVPGGDVMMEPHPAYRLDAEMERSVMLAPEQKAKLMGGGRFKLYSWPMFETMEENINRVRERPLSTPWVTGLAHAPMVYRAMLTGKPYPVKAMITLAKNQLLTMPKSKLIYDALMNLDLHVAMDTFMTPTCSIADYVLPAASCFEKESLQGGNYTLYLQGSEAAVPPLHERRAEFYFWRDLGIRLGQEKHWPWRTLEEFFDYRLEPMGVTFRQFMAGKGYDNPAPRDRKYELKGFATPTGKFELYSTILEKMGYDPLPYWSEPAAGKPGQSEAPDGYPLSLITGARNRRYYHSQDRQIDSIRRGSPDPVAQLNPQKGAELGIADGDWLWAETPVGRATFKCKYSDGILPDVVSAEHGWWYPEDESAESIWRSNINAVLDDDPDMCDAVSGNFIFRGQRCKVYKA
jgi:thiosulfate reductase/polysulfide reductase chain A